MRIASLGEVLWDVFPEGEFLGGAPCNFAAHAARLGNQVWLVSAVGDDHRGREALAGIARTGVRTDFVAVTGDLPTGVVSVTRDAGGEPAYEILRPAAYDRISLTQPLREMLSAGVDWIAFGTLAFTHKAPREFIDDVLAVAKGARRFYDANLREGHYSWPLVEDLIHAADVLKLNEAEARWVQSSAQIAAPDLESFCRQLAPAFQLDTICVTRGPAGCSIFHHGEFVEVAAPRIELANPVGAGDAFSAMFLHGLGNNWPLTTIGERANTLGALVASQTGAVPDYDPAAFLAP